MSKDNRKERERFFSQLAEKITLEEGDKGILDVMREIYRAGTINIKDLAQKVDLPISIVAKIANLFNEANLCARNPKGVYYTEEGMQWAEKVFGFYGFGLSLCPTCYGRPNHITDRFNDYWEYLTEVFDRRPKIDTTLDQAVLDAETAVQKIMYLYDKGALEGKRVLVLGDDDFLSIAIAAWYKNSLPDEPSLVCEELVVMDIDDRILTGIREEIAQIDPNFNVTCLHYDCCEPIPKNYAHHFDTILMDPPYSLMGLQLFLSRGIGMQAKGKGHEIFLSYAHRSPEKTLEIQNAFVETKMALYSLHPRFNYYWGSNVLGNTSQLFHLISTDQSRPIINPMDSCSEPMYTQEFNRRIRFYRCLECEKIIELPQSEDLATIEQLKAAGCLFCHQKGGFRRLNFRKMEELELIDEDEEGLGLAKDSD